MTTKCNIIKGKFRGKAGRVVGVYMDGRTDVKIGRKIVTLAAGSVTWAD